MVRADAADNETTIRQRNNTLQRIRCPYMRLKNARRDAHRASL
jgi:hypothetical protein